MSVGWWVLGVGCWVLCVGGGWWVVGVGVDLWGKACIEAGVMEDLASEVRVISFSL